MSELVLFDTRTRAQGAASSRSSPATRASTAAARRSTPPQHIGNLRPYLFADLLKRALLAEGLRVTHVINVTDVGHLTDDADTGEDKMELRRARAAAAAPRRSRASTPSSGCATAAA